MKLKEGVGRSNKEDTYVAVCDGPGGGRALLTLSGLEGNGEQA